jgi:hypothetical protein
MGYMATNPEGLQRWLEIHHHWQQRRELLEGDRNSLGLRQRDLRSIGSSPRPLTDVLEFIRRH